MTRQIDAPGLVSRKNRDGTKRYYWIAANCVRDTMGFEPPTVRLHYDTDAHRARACRQFAGELAIWIQQRTNPSKSVRPKKSTVRFKGTLASMIDVYELHELSPFHAVSPKTQKGYLEEMAVLRRRVGKRILANVTGEDLLRWHKNFTDLARTDKHDGVRYAHGLMTMLRTVLKFGAVLEHEQPKRLTAALANMRFKNPTPRKTILTLDNAIAVITEAHKQGRASIALGQALQFELTLRQYDVTGQWEPLPDGAERSGVIFRNKIWRRGLTWNNIDDNLLLTILTSKNDIEAEFDLKLYPLVMTEIDGVPAAQRVGPLIIDEDTGRPYSTGRYSRVWRKIARAAGVPDDVWNRDSRAGGITEATDADGSSDNLEQVRHHAQHSSIETTQRYSRNTLTKTSNVAVLRVAHRKGKNGG